MPEKLSKTNELEQLQFCSYIDMTMTMTFTWDEDKNLINQRKHGLSFEIAARVFLDPLHMSIQDRIEGGEQRWQTLGQVDSVAVVLVAHTFVEEGADSERVETIRIISARRATRKERKRYEEG